MEPLTELVPPSRQWTALPLDLVGEISGRLRDAADFVRFHAVCRSWREAAPSAGAIRPRFLPWPLALCNDLLSHLPLNFGCILPSTTSRYGRGYDGVVLRRVLSCSDKNWVASADGTVAWFLRVRSEPSIFNLLTGAITVLPRFPESGYGEINRRMEKSRGIVYSDGTIFLYNLVEGSTFTAAILRPGDVAWTIVEKSPCFGPSHDSSAAYHDGKILVCIGLQFWFVLTPDFKGNGGAGGGSLKMRTIDTSDATKHECNYIFESGNELMWATVRSERSLTFACTGYGLKNTPTVRLHALIGANSGGGMRWVARDGQSMRDRVLFLGSPASFTLNATSLGVRGGCAYLVFKRCVFRYDLINGVAKLMKRVRSRWGSDKAHVWLQPHPPTISPICELREKLKARRKKQK